MGTVGGRVEEGEVSNRDWKHPRTVELVWARDCNLSWKNCTIRRD